MKTAHVVGLCVLVVMSILAIGVYETRLTQAQTTCDLQCLSDKIDALNKRVFSLEQKLGTGSTTSQAPAAVTKTKTAYVYLSGDNAVAADWVTLTSTAFWLDASLYGNVVSISWQGWIDNGKGQVRLYDATNNRAVDGSEVSVSGEGKTSFYSGPMAIWRGQNQYFIQVKSLQAGVVVVSSPRLKIITK